MGLDRPPGAPPRGARQGLLQIRYGLRHLTPPAVVAARRGRVSHSTTRRSSAAAQPAGWYSPTVRPRALASPQAVRWPRVCDSQTETLDGPAGLVGPLPTGRDRDEHGHGEGIARQGEHLDRRRHRLQVDYLGLQGTITRSAARAASSAAVSDRGGVSRTTVATRLARAASRVGRSRAGADVGNDRECGLPAIAPTASRGLRVEVEDDRAHLDRERRRQRRLSLSRLLSTKGGARRCCRLPPSLMPTAACRSRSVRTTGSPSAGSCWTTSGPRTAQSARLELP